jgi:hypothetical protein
VVSLAAFGCGGGTSTPDDAAAIDHSPDGGAPPAGGGAPWTCGAPAPPADLCQLLPTGAIHSCGHTANGDPSQTGYLEIALPDGSRIYKCATSWSPDPSTGYTLAAPETLMSDAQSCCGGPPTPVAPPALPAVAVGPLGALHGPDEIKPQETTAPGNGAIHTNPFAVAVRDQAGGMMAAAARASWQAWAGDGAPHAAPDGSGAYYFPIAARVNYAILETPDGQPVVVLAPEISLTDDDETPFGHPTVGACLAGGGAPLVLMAGEIWGTTLTNHSGRFNHDPSVTRDAVDAAAELFNCLGIPIERTTYYPPKL